MPCGSWSRFLKLQLKAALYSSTQNADVFDCSGCQMPCSDSAGCSCSDICQMPLVQKHRQQNSDFLAEQKHDALGIGQPPFLILIKARGDLDHEIVIIFNTAVFDVQSPGGSSNTSSPTGGIMVSPQE